MNSPSNYAVYTTVYPAARPFLRHWYESVCQQSDCDFDLWIGADGITADEVSACLGEEPSAHWVLSGLGESGASLRLRAMELIIERYDAVIFVDSDDALINSRVASARQALLTHDVAGCALRVIDDAGRETGLVFGPEDGWSPAQLLSRHNVFGLSNTAYRASVLRRCLPFPRKCTLVDWFLATRAWMEGADLYFDRVPRMLYRQHENNTARVIPPFQASDIRRATRRVLEHFDFILPLAAHRSGGFGQSLEDACRDITVFERTVCASPSLLADYTRALNRLQPRFVWWWAVANPQLEHLWKN